MRICWFYHVSVNSPLMRGYVTYYSLEYIPCLYEGWNFNFGNAAVNF